MKMLDFPDSRQGTLDMCGIAAVQAILYYYGKSRIQSELAEAMHLSLDVGTEPEHIVSFFEDEDFQVYFGPMTIDTVKKCIDQGIPVILLIQAWVAEYPVVYDEIATEGHYVVAMGYDDENERIICDDPALMQNRGYIGYEELLTRWRMYGSDENLLENHGIAVYGRHPWFNPETMMHIDGSVKRVAARWRNRNELLTRKR